MIQPNSLDPKLRKEWKLRYWILSGYAVPVLLLIASAGITVYQVRRTTALVAEVDRSALVDERLGKIGIAVQEMSRAVRGYLLEQNSVSVQSFEDGIAAYQRALDDLEILIINEQQKVKLSELNTQVLELEKLNQRLIDLAGVGQVPEAIALWKQDGGRSQIENITTLLEEMDLAQEKIVSDNQIVQNQALEALQYFIGGAAGLSLLLSSLIGIWLVLKASRQMNDSASTIASSTTQIAATVEQQERIAQQQAASVNETTTTMDELGTSSRQSAEQAEVAAAGAQQALELAEGGTRAVDRTLQGMGTLREKVGAIADQIMRLSEQTSQIGSISGLVSDLANQTNMLALNAAVEAVRAGEHGKGFAVVSGEIRKLADQSKQSAEKINALVADIQNAINSTVMATDEGTKTVEEGVRIARETAEAFVGVADAVNNVVLNSQQISLNVKQQAVAIQQVVTAMNSLNAAAQESANGISQVKLGTQQLNQAAVGLQTVI